MDATTIRALKRPALQRLAMANNIKGNLKSTTIIELLLERQANDISIPQKDAPPPIPQNRTRRSARVPLPRSSTDRVGVKTAAPRYKSTSQNPNLTDDNHSHDEHEQAQAEPTPASPVPDRPVPVHGSLDPEVPSPHFVAGLVKMITDVQKSNKDLDAGINEIRAMAATVRSSASRFRDLLDNLRRQRQKNDELVYEWDRGHHRQSPYGKSIEIDGHEVGSRNEEGEHDAFAHGSGITRAAAMRPSLARVSIPNLCDVDSLPPMHHAPQIHAARPPHEDGPAFTREMPGHPRTAPNNKRSRQEIDHDDEPDGATRQHLRARYEQPRQEASASFAREIPSECPCQEMEGGDETGEAGRHHSHAHQEYPLQEANAVFAREMPSEPLVYQEMDGGNELSEMTQHRPRPPRAEPARVSIGGLDSTSDYPAQAKVDKGKGKMSAEEVEKMAQDRRDEVFRRTIKMGRDNIEGRSLQAALGLTNDEVAHDLALSQTYRLLGGPRGPSVHPGLSGRGESFRVVPTVRPAARRMAEQFGMTPGGSRR